MKHKKKYATTSGDEMIKQGCILCEHEINNNHKPYFKI